MEYQSKSPLKIIGEGDKIFLCHPNGEKIWELLLSDFDIRARSGDIMVCNADFYLSPVGQGD